MPSNYDDNFWWTWQNLMLGCTVPSTWQQPFFMNSARPARYFISPHKPTVAVKSEERFKLWTRNNFICHIQGSRLYIEDMCSDLYSIKAHLQTGQLVGKQANSYTNGTTLSIGWPVPVFKELRVPKRGMQHNGLARLPTSWPVCKWAKIEHKSQNTSHRIQILNRP